MSNKKNLSLIVIALFIFGTLFYWYSVRPSQIKKSCSLISKKGVSIKEKKQIKQFYINENCDGLGVADNIIGNLVNDGKHQKIKLCKQYKEQLNAPIKNYKIKATDEEFKQCLREKGL